MANPVVQKLEKELKRVVDKRTTTLNLLEKKIEDEKKKYDGLIKGLEDAIAILKNTEQEEDEEESEF